MKFLIGKILLFSFFLFSVSFSEDICKDVSLFSVKCFEARENGKVKTCEEAVKMVGNKIKDERFWYLYKKACEYGCLSESLHEAVQMEKIILEECKRKK